MRAVRAYVARPSVEPGLPKLGRMPDVRWQRAPGIEFYTPGHLLGCATGVSWRIWAFDSFVVGRRDATKAASARPKPSVGNVGRSLGDSPPPSSARRSG
jgi:hypothetical protein